MSKERRQSSKLWELRSFDVRKNAAAPIIAMLDCSELDTEVSDTGVETTESDDCRGVSKKDGDANGVLARDFPAKMDRSLSTHLPSQSVDCVG